MGLFDMFGGSPQSQGLLAAAAQIAQASGPSRTPRGLYQILGSGALAGQDATQKAQDRAVETQLANIRMQDLQSETAARMRKQQEADRLIKFYSGAGSAAAPGMAMPASEDMAPQSPPIGSMGRPVGAQANAAPNATAVWFDQQMGKVDQLRAAGLIDEATRVEKQALAFRGKATWKDVKRDGKVLNMPFYEDGTAGEVAGAEVAQNLNWQDTGQETLGLDPTFGNVVARQKNTVAPNTAATVAASREASAASNAVARANLGLSAERLNFDKQLRTASEARAEKEFALKQSIGKAPTEFQGKSAAFGLRADEADKILSDLKYSPAAINSKTSVADWPIVGGALGAFTNKFGLTENDQKAEQSQRDFINAVLRQESGAAIADSEFDNARKQYFPQPGDSDAVIAQKARTRQLSIQGLKSNAGRAAITAPDRPVTTKKSAMKGQVMDGYRFKGGNPADPNAWEKL